MIRTMKLTVYAYGKKWKFDIKKYCGYIKCDRLKKVYPISNEATPLTESYDYKSNKLIKHNYAFICNCGYLTYEDYYFHEVFYKGRKVEK